MCVKNNADRSWTKGVIRHIGRSIAHTWLGFKSVHRQAAAGGWRIWPHFAELGALTLQQRTVRLTVIYTKTFRQFQWNWEVDSTRTQCKQPAGGERCGKAHGFRRENLAFFLAGAQLHMHNGVRGSHCSTQHAHAQARSSRIDQRAHAAKQNGPLVDLHVAGPLGSDRSSRAYKVWAQRQDRTNRMDRTQFGLQRRRSIFRGVCSVILLNAESAWHYDLLCTNIKLTIMLK